MALARTAGPTLWFNSSTGQNAYTITGAVTATPGNSIFIAFDICIDPITDLVTTVTLGGVAGVQVEKIASAGNKTTSFIYKWVNHSLSGSQSLIVSISAASAYGISGLSLEYSGTVPPDIDKHNSASGSGPTQQVSLTGAAAHAALITVINSQFADPTVGVGIAFTLEAIQNEFVAHQAGYMDDIGSGGAVLVDWASSDLGWAAAAATIIDAAPAGAVLAGAATAAAAAAGNVSTAIRFAGAPSVVSVAVANLMQMMGGASVVSTVGASLLTAIKLAAGAAVLTSGSGTVTGSVSMAANTVVTSSAAAALTNFSQVTLTAPLYTGPAGALDPHFWLDSKPVVGSVIFYDSTFITIQPNGEINSTNQDCSALMQFFDGTSWALGTVYFTSGLSVYVDASIGALGSLSTAIKLVAAANALVSATGFLNAQIRMGSAAAVLTSAVANLTAVIQLAASVTDDSFAAGVLTGTSGSMFANAVSNTQAGAFLNAQIRMAAASAAVVTAAANLTARILMASAALSVTGAQGSIISATQMVSTVNAAVAASAALLTAIRVAGPVLALVQAAGALSTQIGFAGAAVATSTASGSLTAARALNASATSLTTSTALLSTLINMRSSAFAISNVGGALLTQIPLMGGVLVTDSVTGNLQSTGSPVGLYPQDPFFVIGQRRIRYTQDFPEMAPGDVKVLTFNFADELQPGETLEGIINMNVISSAGQDPGAPGTLLDGPAAYDPTLSEVMQPVHNPEPDTDYYFTVTAPTSNPFKTLTRFGLLSCRA